MVSYPDLSLYSNPRIVDGINIGWLDKQPTTPGSVSQNFLDKLWSYCNAPVVLWRGVLGCGMCDNVAPPPTFFVTAIRADTSVILGAAEILVFGVGTRKYLSPDLIYHFVTMHQYKPPEEYIEAVEHGLDPYSVAYQERLGQMKLRVYPPIRDVVIDPSSGLKRFVREGEDVG